MKRLTSVILVFMTSCMLLFANTSWMDTASPGEDARTSVNVEFVFDPDSMYRTTFGFTSSNQLDWYGDNGDIGNDYYPLITQYVNNQYVYGSGKLNFYWILRSPERITAKVFMAAPLNDLEDVSSSLDWKIVFDARKDGYTYKSESIDSMYGQENAQVIFSQSAGRDTEVHMDYVPFAIETKMIPLDGKAHSFVGNVAVMIEVS